MVGGIVADIYRVEDRNTAMAVFAGAAFFGTGLGVCQMPRAVFKQPTLTHTHTASFFWCHSLPSTVAMGFLCAGNQLWYTRSSFCIPLRRDTRERSTELWG